MTQVGPTTTLTFTRPLAPTDTSKTVLSSEEGETAYLLWAHGVGNELAYHGTTRGTVSLSDLNCSTDLSADEDGDEDDDEEVDCTSSDPDYDFEVAPSGNSDELALFWTVDGSSVAVKVCTYVQEQLPVPGEPHEVWCVGCGRDVLCSGFRRGDG